jgi:hypothetical protein
VYGGIVYYRYLSTIAVTEMIAFGIGYPEAFMRRSLNEISIGLIYVVLFSNKNVISVKGTSFAASTYILSSTIIISFSRLQSVFDSC